MPRLTPLDPATATGEAKELLDGVQAASRTKPRLLALHGTLAASGEPLIDGRPWYDEESRVAVRAAAGDDAELVSYHGLDRFDVLPLSVATDGAIAALGADGRRLRPNIVIAGVAGLASARGPAFTCRSARC